MSYPGEDFVDAKTITLLVEKYYVQHMLDWSFAEPPKFMVDYVLETGKVMLRAMQRVAVQRECVAEYPANWIEALKERFAPKWFLRRWPVRKARIDMEVLYPKIAIPDRAHVVKLHTFGPDDWLRSYSR